MKRNSLNTRLQMPDGPTDSASPKIRKVSLSLSIDIAERLRRLAFEEKLSESSLVEVALHTWFNARDDKRLGHLARKEGATLRRRV